MDLQSECDVIMDQHINKKVLNLRRWFKYVHTVCSISPRKDTNKQPESQQDKKQFMCWNVLYFCLL